MLNADVQDRNINKEISTHCTSFTFCWRMDWILTLLSLIEQCEK